MKATRRETPNRPSRAAEPVDYSDPAYREYDLLLRASPSRAMGIIQQSLAVLVRLLGLCFLVIGIGAAVIILREAWGLYQEPDRMVRFATAIERGSNLDKIFSFGEESANAAGEGESATAEASASSLRLSYFAGWFLVLLLMLVASIVAISAVSAGGRLVLYDTDIRQLSRAVVREVRRNKGR